MKKKEVLSEVFNQKLPSNRKAIALWLIENTSLSFEQIGDFCGMDEFEVKVMADGEVNTNIIPVNPIHANQLTKASIKECEKNPSKKLLLKEKEEIDVKIKKTKYIPIARRGDKPDAIAFLLKYYPNITDKEINKLIGATKILINHIRNKDHWKIKEVTPKDPVLLGLCSQSLLNEIVEKYKIKQDAQ